MNSITLISLLLGIISIYISIKYTENYEIYKYKQTGKMYQQFDKIINKYNINIDDLYGAVIKDEESVKNFFEKLVNDLNNKSDKKKEKFTNYDYYLDTCQRGLCEFNSDLLKHNKSQINKKFTYDDEILLAQKSIKKLEDVDRYKLDSYTISEKQDDNSSIKNDKMSKKYNENTSKKYTKSLDSKQENINVSDNKIISGYNENVYETLYKYDNLSQRVNNSDYKKYKCVNKSNNHSYSRYINEPELCNGTSISCI